MTEKELNELESVLEKNGYRKWTTCLSSSESWGWFKTIKEKDKEDDSGFKYMIEYRVWDYRPYPQSAPKPFGVDVLILLSDEGRIDLNISHVKNLEKIEETAEKFYIFCKENNLTTIYED